ncbi:MAG: hypothetical protein HYV09_12335 [Deltaproteobacteria bacterium]|nr:hypothetical protein [Deltaproteobacteria bacterium]
MKTIGGELVKLELEGKLLVGELALELPPGTTAGVRDKSIDALLGDRLIDAAASVDAVVAAAASAFAFPRPGKDPKGRTVFDVRGRIEGDRLLPSRPGKQAR